MCGVFGLIRCGEDHSQTASFRAVSAFMALGEQSDERGKDSAGVALVNILHKPAKKITQPEESHVNSKTCTIDNVSVLKDTVAFSKLPLQSYRRELEAAHVLLGHTRWATQGKAEELTNASPLVVGSLVGTHNGDVEVSSIPGYRISKKFAFGATDTERLYLTLSAAGSDRQKITRVLRSIQGRAALVWVDRTRPERLYLARTALAPLCYAYDNDGNFYYASNPDWFRQIEKESQGVVEFPEITLIPEGYLITVNTFTGEIDDMRHFTPTCRERDVRMMNLSAYRGFTPEDRAADMALHRHRVINEPLSTTWPDLAPAPTITPVSAGQAGLLSQAPAPQINISNSDDIWDRDLEYQNLDMPQDIIIPDTGNGDLTLEQLEELCWIDGKFDHETFEAVIAAPTPEEGEALVLELLERISY